MDRKGADLPLQPARESAQANIPYACREDLASCAAQGLAYWKLLSDIINQEPVQERDRIVMATLKLAAQGEFEEQLIWCFVNLNFPR
jgi:hypothetical protein